jgi:arylsulfatase A-like enzyme
VPAKTPNIDRLAASGQIFGKALSAFHATTMSMSALFTGLTPSIESGSQRASLAWNTFASCGMSRFSVPGQDDGCLPQSLDTLAEDLQGAGYWTLGVVANELLYRPAGYDQGFDEWVEVGSTPPDLRKNLFKVARVRTAGDVNREVLRALAKRPSDRFFLYVHYIDVHDWSLFRRSYKESVELFDERLGELLDRLESDGLLEDASVLLTSDHGEMLVDQHLGVKTVRHYGNPSFEPLMEIPLIVNPPTEADAGAMIRSQDVRGMIGKIAGIGGGGAKDLAPDELYVSEMTFQHYRKGRYKSLWARKGSSLMLFDLESDPHEYMNIAGKHADILAEHRNRIDELSRALASNPSQVMPLSDEDLERLRMLGYLESTESEFLNRALTPEAPAARERVTEPN